MPHDQKCQPLVALHGVTAAVARMGRFIRPSVVEGELRAAGRGPPWLAVGLVLLVVHPDRTASAQQPAHDWDSYRRTAEYCRGDVPRPMAISADRQVLRFDGDVASDLDVSPATQLNKGDLFVVRNSGGATAPAIALSNQLRDRQAMLVIYDYCLSVCANYDIQRGGRLPCLQASG